MPETQEPTALTTEQQQRLIATDNASKFLRDGGASLVKNTTESGDVRDIIDLAHYIVTGVPFVVAWAHEHQCVQPVIVNMSDLVNLIGDDEPKAAPAEDAPDFD